MTDGRRWTLRLFGLVANYRSPWRRFALSASRNAPLRRSRRGRKRVTPCPYVSAACLWGGGAVSAADDRENGHGAPLLDELAAKVLVEPDIAKRDLLIKEAFEIAAKDFAYIPLHQQALAWGVSKKMKVVQRADNAVLPYYMTKQE